MTQGNITVEKIKAQFPDAVLQVDETQGDVTVTLHVARLLDVCRFLRDDPELHYDLLSFVTAVDRLDMGIQPFLVASSLLLVVGQRLARRICPHCKEVFTPSSALLAELGIEDASPDFYRGAGCSFCNHTGYRGRLAFFEVLQPTSTIKEMIVARSHAEAIRRQACDEGFLPLREVGLRHALAGETTIEEVLRVTMEIS